MVSVMPEALRPDAIAEIIEIARHSFPVVWAPRDFEYFLTHECGLSLGLFQPREGGGPPRLVAYLIGLLVQGDLDIVSIATHPSVRRKGYAEELLRACLIQPRVKRALLEVDVQNHAAIALYEKLGFVIQGKRLGYYRGQGDAYLMARGASR